MSKRQLEDKLLIQTEVTSKQTDLPFIKSFHTRVLTHYCKCTMSSPCEYVAAQTTEEINMSASSMIDLSVT